MQDYVVATVAENLYVMSLFLVIVGWICFVLAILVGLALDLVGLFGNWVILAALVTVWILSGFERFGPWSIALFTGMACLGEVVEGVAAGFGAKKFGAEKGAILAALAGCLAGSVVGTALFPILGTLAVGCLGAFIGAVAYQYIVREKQAHDALWTGLGAALGRIAGVFAKLLIGFAMLFAAALMY